ncbi:unnamed protein product, partial [Prorocentrum cordatum]
VLAEGGRWVLYGLMGGASVDGPVLEALLRKRIRLEATTLRSRSLAYRVDITQRFVKYTTDNDRFSWQDYGVVLDSSRFRLDEAALAHERMEPLGPAGPDRGAQRGEVVEAHTDLQNFGGARGGRGGARGRARSEPGPPPPRASSRAGGCAQARSLGRRACPSRRPVRLSPRSSPCGLHRRAVRSKNRR